MIIKNGSRVFTLLPYILGVYVMFKLIDSLKFIEVDSSYVKALHNVCNEVYYRPDEYEKKPYLGILLNSNGYQYVIPLSSAKEKHKSWKNLYPDRMLIYEVSEVSKLSDASIFVQIQNDNAHVKHIMSVIDFKKMVPIKEGVYSVINFNPSSADTDEQAKYKDLLNKEYRFCIKNIDKIINRASKIYDYQKKTGKIIRFACDFSSLERVCNTY